MSHNGCPKCGASISSGKKCGSCGAVSLPFTAVACLRDVFVWLGSLLTGPA